MKVILAAAATICGRISPPGGSRLDRQRLEELRDRTGASIIGANTLRQENPEMRASGGVLPPERLRAVITRSGSIPVAGKNLFQHGPRPVVFTEKEAASSLQERLKNKARIIVLPQGPGGLSLTAALDFFSAEGVESLLIEGGARLNYAALKEGLVDEIHLTLAPFVSGDRNSAALADGPMPLGDPFLALELVSSEPLASGELFLHYRVPKTT